MSNLGSTKIFVDKTQWNSRTSRQKGRSSEALAVNANLDAISASLHSLYHKYQDDQTISLDKLRSAYLGQIQEFSTASLGRYHPKSIGGYCKYASC